MCPLPGLFPRRKGYRRGETAAPALVVAPDSGYLVTRRNRQRLLAGKPDEAPIPPRD